MLGTPASGTSIAASAHVQNRFSSILPPRVVRGLSLAILGLTLNCAGAAGPTNAILFVTQMPVPADFTAIGSVFGNHRAGMEDTGRGGDLYIRYPDGVLRNLTREAGYGKTGLQSTNGIAVREPSMHWSGAKAVFSMVVGSPHKQYDYSTYYWQLYEITGFDRGATPVITRVANQPTNFNNVSPIYGTDERIIFTSDRPRNGQRHLYPQLDEYEEAPTITGLWSLDPVSGDLFLMTHTPSGAFSPILDSFGRVIFTRWDHLQRDQQADSDAEAIAGGQAPGYQTFNYPDESATAPVLTNNRAEVFPEPRIGGGNLNGHTFNQFFPWQINEDGTEEETLNHVGRHELGGYLRQSFSDDPNLREFYNVAARFNTNALSNFLQIEEDPRNPGTYFGIDAPEFYTHAGGQLATVTGATSVNPDRMKTTYLTPRATASFTSDGTTPPTNHTGFYRNPLPMSDGTLIAVHTAETRLDANQGTRANPRSRYDFRLKTLKLVNGYYVPDQFLTSGLTNVLSYYDPDVLVTYTNRLWELDPVEVRPRTKPARLTAHLPPPEERVFMEEGVDVDTFKSFLRANELALIVSRNVTTRDRADLQQPFNLQVAGTTTQSIGAGGKVYDVAHIQFFQADQLRGLFNGSRPGRRVLAQLMHDPAVDNPQNTGGPVASTRLGDDGSMAALVPARRALTWHLTDPAGASVVKERYWLTFQPGEIRTCASCHGINTSDQASRPTPTNQPAALRSLLQYWKAQNVPVVGRVADANNEYLSLTFKRRAAVTNVIQTVELSGNLIDWLAGSSYSASGSTPNTPLTTEILRVGTTNQTITVRDNQPINGGAQKFMRLRVMSP